MAQAEDFDAPEALLTPSEVAALFRVNPKTVTRWARAGKLTAPCRPYGPRSCDRSASSSPTGTPG